MLLSETTNIILTSVIRFTKNPVMRGSIAVLSAVASITASCYLAARFLDKRPFKSLGLELSPRWWQDLLFGLGLGAVLLAAIFIIELGLGWIRIDALPFLHLIQFIPRILVAALFYISVGFYEELLTRGYLLKNLSEGFSSSLSPGLSVSLSALLTSVFFGLLHAANPHANPFAILNIILAGLVLAFAYLCTGQLGLSIGFHISWNFFQGPLLGFPVSGSTFLSGLMIKITQSGPTLWTGGVFGPEGGLMGVLALTLALALIWYWKWDGIDPSIAHYQPRAPKSVP